MRTINMSLESTSAHVYQIVHYWAKIIAGSSSVSEISEGSATVPEMPREVAAIMSNWRAGGDSTANLVLSRRRILLLKYV